jgi:hypothetical protein
MNDRAIFRAFKSKGLTLTADASRALCKILISETDWEDTLNNILDEIKERIEKRDIKSSVIDVNAVSDVVAYMTSDEEDSKRESTQYFDAFESPKIQFDERTKTYKVNPKPTYKLHGSAESRRDMYRERLLFTQQRLLRSGLYVNKTMGQGLGSANINRKSEASELSSIESLMRSNPNPNPNPHPNPNPNSNPNPNLNPNPNSNLGQ